MNILIVDDNEDSRMILKKTLESDGHTVQAAINGEAALKMAKKSPPDMIISDILMPVMDGFTLCCECKSDEQLRRIPFIFHTATYTDSKDEELALRMGADKFIRKPVELDEFIKIIRDMIKDAKKGKIRTKKPAVEDEKDIFKLYSERLINKLEKKMLDLEGEIAGRKQAEKKIQQSLREKETLLSEIHHRVKNNMQIISSLLSLQSKDIDDERARSLIKNCEDRIRSMALVHEKLYLSEDLSRIDFSDYVEGMATRLFQVHRVNSEAVNFSSHAGDVLFNIETAIPLGLIINELISNAIKHAFPEGRKGTIAVKLTKSKKTEEYILTVTDDGIGFPEEIDYRNPETFGLQLVEMLTEQLRGTVEL
ncbi:MAG: response regulator, partial [Deltaproteobacteria bacterium]|nr:response regulator [Deltaproteobacteria bacterium]